MSAGYPTPKDGWFVSGPLQIESLRRRLPETQQTDQLLRRLRHYRENLDAVVYALSSRELAEDRRKHLATMLQRHRSAFESCLADLGTRPRPSTADALWHFHQLAPMVREHLVNILGVPEEPAFYDVLDVKAQEYLAQLQAFEMIAADAQFTVRHRLPRGAKNGALVLTMSGSLIQLSPPNARGGRRYLYQNIYGNTHPPEGTLVLDRDIRVGHRLRSVELTTSAVQMLRVASRRMSWKAQSRTFARLSRIIQTLSGDPAKAAQRDGRTFNAQAARRVLHEEYAEAFERLAALEGSYRDVADGSEGERVEAELLAVCHYLQTGARELGFDARPLKELREIVTADGHTYLVDEQRRTLIRRARRGPEVIYPAVTISRQLVTCGAPLVLIGQGGGVVELIQAVDRLKRRK